MKTISLDGVWHLCGRNEETGEDALSLTARVPGCVALDLAEAGYLPEDLFMGENIRMAEDYEPYEWWYEREFEAPDCRENLFLVFEGVDCVAEYFLNGVRIGESRNMLISHGFAVGDYVKDGTNTLTVHLFSTVLAAHGKGATLYSILSKNGGAQETQLRRAPHSYGWDIMPRSVTGGIWRGVRLELRDEIRFSQIYFKTDKEGFEFFYELECPWQAMKALSFRLRGASGDSSFDVTVPSFGRKASSHRVRVPEPKLWWPYGYGEANVYDVTVEILRGGQVVHTENTTIGLRTVELDRTDTTDGKNGRFRFLINGVEIMCKGSNWVPLDVFHSRDAERYEKALALVKDIGCNILRCWGGNVYEDHAFFDFCDRNGVMVWQDFSMACRIYPMDEDYNAQLWEEAESVVRKLRNHPSIILWSGDNEVDQLLRNFLDPNTYDVTRKLLPQVVMVNDLSRPFLASSPYVSPDAYAYDGGRLLPEDHLWGPRDYYKADFYKQNKAHFVSETGYHGCPSLDSIKKFITPGKVWPYHNNSEWILHSTDQRGNDGRVMLMEKQVRQLFGEVPTDPETYILASQISQAEAKKYFIERIRVGRPNKTGIIWWNLLDGWPQMSDAVVDYYFEKKLAYGYIKRSEAPFVIAADEIAAWNLTLYACNDTLTEKKGHFEVIDTTDGRVIREGDFIAAKNGSTPVCRIETFYSEKKMLLFRWTLSDGTAGFNHYLCGYPPFSLSDYTAVMKKYGLEEK